MRVDAVSAGTSAPGSEVADARRSQSLEALFAPRAIAIVGASGRADNPFARPLQYLTSYGYAGDIYPVNPGYDTLHGLRCYPDMESIPGPVDLALLLVPAAKVPGLFPSLAAAGVRVAVVFASGFGEAGEDGRVLQRELLDAAQAHGIRVVGPNCQGVLSVGTRTYGTFTAAVETGPIRQGGLAYAGQSGAVGGSILSLAEERGIGISSWVSTGNQADLDSIELGRHLIEKDETTVLALYLESAVDERDFRELARRALELGKSLIVLRSATSPTGARAAASHTGAIVGDDAGFRVVADEYGVIEATDIDDLVALAHAHTALPRSAGNTVAIVTTSGGAGSLAADAAFENGLDVVTLNEAAQEQLRAFIPAFGATENPVDVTAQIFHSRDVTDFVSVCRITLDQQEVDAAMIVLTLVTGDLAVSMARALAAARFDKPVALVWAASRAQTAQARAILQESDIPVFESTRQAAFALRSLVRTKPRSDLVERPAGYDAPAVQRLLARLGGGTVTESAARELLTAVGVEQPRSWLVHDSSEAAELAEGLTAPVVVKIQAPSVVHKTERGGVVLGVTPADLVDAVKRLLDAFAGERIEGVLVSDMAPAGVEFIFGVTRSAISGLPMATVGLGGTATEIYRDTVTTFAPVSAARVVEMLGRLRAAPLLAGYRGAPPVDLPAVAATIERLSWLSVDVGAQLHELEINPLRAGAGSVLALDFLMILDPGEGQ